MCKNKKTKVHLNDNSKHCVYNITHLLQKKKFIDKQYNYY